MKPFYCKFLKEDCVKGVKEHNHCMEYCWNCTHYGKILKPTEEEINEQNKPF